MAAPLPTHQVNYIVQLLALGNTSTQIREKMMVRYGVAPHKGTISRIRKRQLNNISDAQEVLISKSDIVGPALLKQKTHQLLNNKLDRAIGGEADIAALRAKYQAGEIDKSEFDAEVDKYDLLTTNELVKISDAMHTQSKGNDEPVALTPQDQAALQLLMAGIQSGNPVQLIQVLNPSRTAENPATPE